MRILTDGTHSKSEFIQEVTFIMKRLTIIEDILDNIYINM